MDLQKYLNKNGFTLRTTAGPGSAGDETDHFGFLTTQALIKFQNFFASAILAPLGLHQGPETVSLAPEISLTPHP